MVKVTNVQKTPVLINRREGLSVLHKIDDHNASLFRGSTANNYVKH